MSYKKISSAKGEGGITLLALVVTIVVMLILAGITLNMSIDNNGVIGKAEEARNLYLNASDDEQEGFNRIKEIAERVHNNVTQGDTASDDTQQQCEITFEGNGGIGNISSIHVKKGEQISLPANQFERAYYTFKGWSTSRDGSGVAYKPATVMKIIADVTFYAQWEKNKVTVSFNANGGSGTMDSISVDQSETVTLPQNEFTKIGYVFKEWNTTQDGSGVAYQNGQATEVYEDLSLYAMWSVKTYTITYDLNGGEASGNPTSFDINTNTFTLNNPTKANYNFLGWTGSNSTTPELTVTIDKGSIGDRYYKANFGTSRVITAKISRYCTRYNTGGYNDASCTMNIVPANSATLNGSLAFSGAQYQGGDGGSRSLTIGSWTPTTTTATIYGTMYVYHGSNCGGAAVGELSFSNLPAKTTITVSNISSGGGDSRTEMYYIKNNQKTSYTTKSDNETVTLYMYYYRGDEASKGTSSMDYRIDLPTVWQ